MKIALCYENVLPARGGCETYIADLTRQLLRDGQEVHLYACRYDAEALPVGIHYHPLPARSVPRFLRPWHFSALCRRALAQGDHDVSLGFDKILGTDVLYPQAGLHRASAAYNLRKHRLRWLRVLAWAARRLDLAHWSYCLLERRQYTGPHRPLLVVNSHFVRQHLEYYYGVPAAEVRVVPSAVAVERLLASDRPRRRQEGRQRWRLAPEDTVALFAAMNYRLKGLEPLLRAVQHLCQRSSHPAATSFRLLVAGHPDYQPYARLARRLGIADRVRFVGYCPDMRWCYFAADFVVQPTFYDTCSLVVLEALACGLPVITTRASGASEFLQPPREGYVLDDPHDTAQLAWCLEQLLEPQRRRACGQAALRTASRWTFAEHYRQLFAVLQEAAQRRRAVRAHSAECRQSPA
jgi:UDP-glucose:(heptosyl)LPS alpha-1,3-glucosyltransferase